MKSIKNILKPKIIVPFLAAVILFVLMFVLKLGVADNGDFGRIMAPTGLDKIGNSYFKFTEDSARILNYRWIVPAQGCITLWEILFGGCYISSHLVPIFIARFISIAVIENGYFSFLILALIYSCFFIAGIYILTKTINKWWIVPIVIFVLCDATKVLYFNSLYGEAWAYVTFLLAFVFLLRDNKKMFYLFITLFFSAKSQYLPLAYSLIFFIDWKHVKKCIAIFSIIILCLTAYFLTPPAISRDTLFNSVFNGVLKNSTTVEADLEELGLPVSYANWANCTVYDFYDILHSPYFFDCYNNLSRGKVISFYLHHPFRFMQKLSMQEPFSNRTGMLANFPESSGKIGEKNSIWTSWDYITSNFFPKNAYVVIAIYLLIFALGCAIKDRKIMFFVALALPQYVLPILGNGSTDAAKQLFMFNVVTDFIIIYLIYIWSMKKLSIKGNKNEINL